MKNWIRRYLGMEDTYNQMVALNNYISGLRGEVGAIRTQVSVTNRAVGRIVAKLDPAFADSEHDPARKIDSDALGDAVIQRLLGEVHYSNRTRID